MGVIARYRRRTYQAARAMGDLDAALKGPLPYAKRRARRVIYRHVNRALSRSLKGWLT